MIATMLILALLACAPSEDPFAYSEQREPCADFRPDRRALFGDFHVHTGFSFDARVYDNQMSPTDAHDFARGSAIELTGGRALQLTTPLDFVGITDHAEFLGEVARCTTPGADGYDSGVCVDYRGGDDGALDFGSMMANPDPTRWPEVCGDDDCRPEAGERWQAMAAAAEAAYDRTSACSFTAFASYEYTNTRGISNRHRNVVFRNADVPALPVTTFEAKTPVELWRQLDEQCNEADDSCDVIVIPHNSNLSNGWEFTLADQSFADLELRARMEPLVEVFQHKGDSECSGQHSNGAADPLCDFEKLRPPTDPLCLGDELGTGGMRLWGCSNRLDFVRNVLLEGLSEAAAGRPNPYRLGIMASTDTHNAAPGYTESEDFQGHVGTVDDTIDKRLGDGNITHDTIITNPGGLIAVWAEENSRDAIFRSLRRKETFATSGPRIIVRFFGGWNLPTDVCSGPDLALYDDAVTMGSELTRSRADAPSFAVRATRDRTLLERVQIVKGWVDADGTPHEQVTDVSGSAGGAGDDALCAVWTDPSFDADLHAFYYARAVEVPTQRWTARQCATFTDAERPPRCAEMPATVQQRAWSSPIWYAPPDP